MIFSEIKNYDMLCATIRKLFVNYSGLSRSAVSALDQCTAQSAANMRAKTEPHWYALSMTDEELKTVEHLFKFENAYGIIGRTILHDNERNVLPKFLRKAKMADVTNPDFRPKARSYTLIWGYYTEEQARLSTGDIFPELMAEWEARRTKPRSSTQASWR